MNHTDSEAKNPQTQRSWSLRLSAAVYGLAVLTVAAAILRFLRLNSKSLWLDEAMSANLVAGTLWSHAGQFASTEAHMLLYYLMLHWWSRFGGSSEFSLRLPSAILAVATVPLIYALGTELCDRRVGLMAALLLSVNVTCIQFGQQARGYSMVMMLVVLSSLLFIKSIKQSSLACERGYVAAGTLAAYAHIFGVLILPAQWLSLFLFPTDRKTRLRMTARIAVVALFSLPPIILLIHGDSGQVGWIPVTSADAVIRLFAMFAGLYWGDLSHGLKLVLFAIYLVSIGIALAGASERQRSVVGFLFLSVIVPVGVAIVVSMFQPLFVARYLLVCHPFFVILAAIGLTRIKPRMVMVAITVLVVALSLSEDLNFYDHGTMQDWRGAINFVAANAKPDDVLLVFPEWNKSPVDYYVGRLSGPADFRVITDRLHGLDGTGGASNDQDDSLRRFLAKHGVNSYMRVWIVTDVAHRDEPALHELEIGHQVAAGPNLVGLVLVRID